MLRPRILRPLTIVSAIAVVIAFVALSIALTTVEWRAWSPYDAIWLNGIGLIIAAGLWRLGAIAAFADASGLRVRNVAGTRSFTWTQIVGVTFSEGSGHPWPLLDLSDGETWPVMAIQAADGRHGYEAAHRLRRLIDTYGSPGVHGR